MQPMFQNELKEIRWYKIMENTKKSEGRMFEIQTWGYRTQENFLNKKIISINEQLVRKNE